MKTDNIKRKLIAKLEKYCLDNDYRDGLENFKVVSTENHREGYTDIYIYFDVPVEEFFKYDEMFNDVVTKYDESAYFDIVKPGIFMARLYWDSLKYSEDANNSQILTQSNLIKFGEYISYKLEDEYDVEFWVDTIDYNDRTQTLSFTISSDKLDIELTTSIKLYEDDIDSYQDILDLYSQKLYRVCVKEIDNLISTNR